MRDVSLALRRYLWGYYLLGAAVLVGHGWLLRGMPVRRGELTAPHLGQAIVFVALAYVGDRLTLRMRGTNHQSLGTAVQIAALVLFPPPLPLLIILPGVLVSEARRTHLPCYKRAFNICHAIVAVGLCDLLIAPLTILPIDLRPAHSLVALPVLGLMLLLYYLLDVGSTLLVFALLERQALWRLWWRTSRHSLVPELTGSTLGILLAAVWQFNPVVVVLFAAPIAGLRLSFRAHAQAERRGVQLETVLATAQQLRVQQCTADTLRRVAAGARALSGATAATAYARDPDDPTLLERVALEPDDAPDAGPATVPLTAIERGLSDAMDERGRMMLVPVEATRDDGDVVIIGALRLMGLPTPLSDADRSVLALLATQAGTALENARLHAQALAQASEDSLTGLLNHRVFQERAEQEVARARRGGQPLALMMIDLDDFGTINNVHGHQAGDVALLAVARCLGTQTRATDIAARYGGDEFAMILPETTGGEALDTAERIRGALARLTVAHGGQTIRVTASIGIAVMPDHATTREDLIGLADNAAYAAKCAGKDRVCQAEVGALPRDPVALAARLDDANLATVEALAAMVDAKDAYTRGHSGRVAAYAAAIAAARGLPATDVARIHQAGILHDVGKIGVPDAILLKPSGLTDEEFAVIKEHPVIGERVLQGLPFLGEILPAVRHHHERWDGRGYPDGLAGDTIPPDAAILAVADSFDAMTSSRTYRPALPVDEAIRRVREGAGAQYDPRVVAAFNRALADGALALPLVSVEALRALPSVESASNRAGGTRGTALRIVG